MFYKIYANYTKKVFFNLFFFLLSQFFNFWLKKNKQIIKTNSFFFWFFINLPPMKMNYLYLKKLIYYAEEISQCRLGTVH